LLWDFANLELSTVCTGWDVRGLSNGTHSNLTFLCT